MNKPGIALVWTGVLLAVIMGLVASLDRGYVCRLDAENLPETLWS